MALNETAQAKYLVQPMLVFISSVAVNQALNRVMGNHLFNTEFHGYLLSVNFVLISASKELTV